MTEEKWHRETVLCSALGGGEYDPFMNCVRVEYGPRSLGHLLSPDPLMVRHAFNVLHEYAHFYQLTTTTYGLYYRMVQLAEYLTFCRALRISAESGTPLRPPLVPYAPRRLTLDPDLPTDEAYAKYERELSEHYRRPEPDDDGPLAAELRKLTELTTLRLVLCSYGELRSPHESRLGPALVHEAFPDLPMVVPVWPPARYGWTHDFGLGDLLENHALIMSGAWLMSSAERLGAPTVVRERLRELFTETVATAEPTYTRLTAGALSPSPSDRELTAIAACVDLALNPSLVRAGRDNAFAVRFGDADRQLTLQMRTDVEFEPLTRFVLLARGLGNPSAGTRLGALGGDRADLARTIVELAGERLRADGGSVDHPPAVPPFATDHAAFAYQAARQVVEYGNAGEVPLPVALLFADMFGTLSRALAVRQDTPLMMASGTHHEIDWLISRLGGVNLVAAREGRVYVRPVVGLHRILRPDDRLLREIAGLRLRPRPKGAGDPLSDWIARQAMPHLYAFRMLLYRRPDEIRAELDRPAFGFAGPTIRDALRQHRIDPDRFDS